jgi:hypothetical protein
LTTNKKIGGRQLNLALSLEAASPLPQITAFVERQTHLIPINSIKTNVS